MKIIGLSGKAGSGKDFLAANHIKQYGYRNISFAWHMKMNVIAKGLATYEEVFVTKPANVRHILQQEGTELGRNVYGEDVWVKATYAWMQLLSEQWDINQFVITDVRFPNEVNFVRNMGGRVYRVEAPRRVAKSGLSDEARLHASETALDDFPIEKFNGIIHNDIGFGKYDIEDEVASFMQSYK